MFILVYRFFTVDCFTYVVLLNVSLNVQCTVAEESEEEKQRKFEEEKAQIDKERAKQEYAAAVNEAGSYVNYLVTCYVLNNGMLQLLMKLVVMLIIWLRVTC